MNVIIMKPAEQAKA